MLMSLAPAHMADAIRDVDVSKIDRFATAKRQIWSWSHGLATQN